MLAAYRKGKASAVGGGEWDATSLGAKPAQWDSWDAGQRSRFLDYGAWAVDKSDAELASNYGALSVEGRYKSVLKGDYVDPTTGRSANSGPVASDLTDQAIQKARTNAWQRLQMGKTAKSSFAVSGQMGGFDVSKPTLGGY